MNVDDDIHQRVKPARLPKILDQYRKGQAGAANGESA